MARHDITLPQAMAWRPWSYTDKERIEAEIERLRVERFERDTGVVRCFRATGELVLFIYPGYVMFARGAAPHGWPVGKWPGFELSTFKPYLGSKQQPRAEQAICPVHGTVLPMTCRCDDCDE